MKYDTVLEFNKILEKLCDNALSEKAKEQILDIKPILEQRKLLNKITETTDAKKIIEALGTPPLGCLSGIYKTLVLCEKGSMLTPEQLTQISQFANNCMRMKKYLKKSESLNLSLGYSGEAIFELEELSSTIENCIRNNSVDSHASKALKDIRGKIENKNTAVKEKIDSMLRSNKAYLADSFVVTRHGRLVLPVKKDFKNKISGTVVDISGTGSTVFIEPSSVKKIQDELAILLIDEENEVKRILYTLTAQVYDNINELKSNISSIEILDFAFAKGKLSIDMRAIPAEVTTDRKIMIKQGIHPLLDRESCVPLDFEIGGETRGVVITGPNTGGKTVALKTVGLLSMMAQSGLHVPVAEGSVFCMNSNILCDIGDGQSIAESLSTFSSHIKSIIEILQYTTQDSLVLLDELGSGTDPSEGMGLAVSILEELRKRSCLFLATTHYPEIKEFANKSDSIINARMEFDKESLKPLYKLEIGEAGESCAFHIAEKLGFPKHMLRLAAKTAYPELPEKIYNEETEITNNVHVPKIVPIAPQKTLKHIEEKFSIGDSVEVYPEKSIGIICALANSSGEFGVQLKGKKIFLNHKRIKLLVKASELYPEDYDFSILFDTVQNRKARHKMTKKHDPTLIINYE